MITWITEKIKKCIHIYKRIPSRDYIGVRKCLLCGKVQIAYSIVCEYDWRGNSKICGWRDEK